MIAGSCAECVRACAVVKETNFGDPFLVETDRPMMGNKTKCEDCFHLC